MKLFSAVPGGNARSLKLVAFSTPKLMVLVFVACAGNALAQTFAAIKASSGTSFVHETESQLILNGSYNIGFTMDLACKDLGFAYRYGRELGVPLELAALTEQIFRRAPLFSTQKPITCFSAGVRRGIAWT